MVEYPHYKLPERLEALREKFNLSKSQLGAKLGLGNMTINRWETGEQIPSALFVLILCEFFGCSAGYLIGLEN